MRTGKTRGARAGRSRVGGLGAEGPPSRSMPYERPAEGLEVDAEVSPTARRLSAIGAHRLVGRATVVQAAVDDHLDRFAAVRLPEIGIAPRLLADYHQQEAAHRRPRGRVRRPSARSHRLLRTPAGLRRGPG